MTALCTSSTLSTARAPASRHRLHPRLRLHPRHRHRHRRPYRPHASTARRPRAVATPPTPQAPLLIRMRRCLYHRCPHMHRSRPTPLPPLRHRPWHLLRPEDIPRRRPRCRHCPRHRRPHPLCPFRNCPLRPRPRPRPLRLFLPNRRPTHRRRLCRRRRWRPRRPADTRPHHPLPLPLRLRRRERRRLRPRSSGSAI